MPRCAAMWSSVWGTEMISDWTRRIEGGRRPPSLFSLLVCLGLGSCLISASVWAKPRPEWEGCIHEAAVRHRVPASLIRAILMVEGGQVGQTVSNRNGSVDIGPMQINSIWLPEIERRGGSFRLIRDHSCANIHFGTWLLSREITRFDVTGLDRQTFWRAVGNYHSRTPELNSRYAERVWNAWRRLGQ